MSAVETRFKATFLGTKPHKLSALRRCKRPLAIFATHPGDSYLECGDELRIPVTPADAVALHLLSSKRDDLQVEMTLTWRLP